MKVKNTSSAIYKITNDINGKVYVGSSINVFKRKESHQNKLRTQKHKNSHLQNAWDLYGEDNFTFEIIEYIFDNKDLFVREQFWMDHYQCYEKEKGYNILSFAGYKINTKEKVEIYLSDKLVKLRSNKLIEKIDGKDKDGKKKIWSKISDDEVYDIRILISNGATIKELAIKYNVSEALISNIKYGIMRNNIAPELITEKVKRTKKIDLCVVIDIKKMLSEGTPISKIIEKTGESKNAIQRIKGNLSYRNITDENSIEIKKDKLPKEVVLEIRDYLSNGVTLMEISKKLDIRYGTIMKIRDGHSYKNII